MEQPPRHLSGFPTVVPETVLLLACHTFLNLSASVRGTTVDRDEFRSQMVEQLFLWGSGGAVFFLVRIP